MFLFHGLFLFVDVAARTLCMLRLYEVSLVFAGQLQVECFAVSMCDVYTFGPTFRAERSDTYRHLAEFWMIEPEIW